MTQSSAPGRRRPRRGVAIAAVAFAVFAAALAVGAAAVPRREGAAAVSAAPAAAASSKTAAAATAAVAASADNETNADDTLMVMDQVIHKTPSTAMTSWVSAAASARQTLTRRPQIVNGVTETRAFLSGFMVRLLKAPRRGSANPIFTCGGARITTRHVLTAGHCAPAIGDVVAIGGTGIEEGLRYLVVNVTYPPGGSVSRADLGVLDIAVIEYESSAPLGSRGGIAATPVESAVADAGVKADANAGPPRPEVKLEDLRIARVAKTANGGLRTNRSITTLGWGAVYPEKIGALFGPSSTLRSVQTRVWNGDDCSVAYASVAVSRPPYMFCAAADGAGPCAGDSGGPAGYFPGDGGGFVVAGLVSGTISSLFYRCEPAAPSFYTNVGFFYDFLSEAVAPLKLIT
ncbi:hypothetical protein MMPV_005571 [Pyropia vietnamensis]